MANGGCRAGRIWDSLVHQCVPRETETRLKPGPPTEPSLADVVQLRATTSSTKDYFQMLLSPALWAFVVVVILVSSLVLVLWFIIYRRQTSRSSTSEDAEPQQEPKPEQPSKIYPLPSGTNSNAEMSQRATGSLSPYPHMNLGAQSSFKWEEDFTAFRGHPKHVGTEVGGDLSTCITMREHRVPLPATELGGTALVTTKM